MRRDVFHINNLTPSHNSASNSASFNPSNPFVYPAIPKSSILCHGPEISRRPLADGAPHQKS